MNRSSDFCMIKKPMRGWSTGFSATFSKIDLTGEERKWIQAHPVIRLGIDPEFIPFEFMTDKKEYMGMAKDYVCLLNARLGPNMQVAGNRSWTQFVEMAKKKKIDVFPCAGITQEKKYLLFSKPYTSFFRVNIARNDLHYIFSVDDLKKYRVCVQENSSHHGYLMEKTQTTPGAGVIPTD